MRILHVVPYLSPKMGGSVRVAAQLATHLARRGHDVVVAASDYGVREAGVLDGPFRTLLFPSVLSRWGMHMTLGLAAWSQASIRNFDIVHLHELRTFQNVVAGHAARAARVPYMLSAHGTAPIIVQRRLLKRGFDCCFGRRLIAGARCLLAVSPTEVEHYRALGVEASRICLIYNGLEQAEARDLPPRGSFRNRWLGGAVSQVKLVVFLGRLHRRKGVGDLLRAFARLVEEPFPAMLVIAGPDEGELGRLRALAGRLDLRERVRFVGPLYGLDRLAALRDADVVAYPGRHEIFGLVPWEALMCGTPVVVAGDSGSGELIAAARAGYVAPPGDPLELAAALRRALANPTEARARVAAGQTFIRQHLDWKLIAAQVEHVYAEAIGESGCR